MTRVRPRRFELPPIHFEIDQRLLGAGTVACLVPLVDALPRWLVAQTAAPVGLRLGGSVPAGTLAWMAIACLSWAGMAACAGFLLACAGQRGCRFLGVLAQPLAGLIRICGLKRLAALLRFP